VFGMPVLQRIRIEVNPRVHLGLISMHPTGPRKNGGVGFSLNGPTAIVEINQAPYLSVVDERSNAYDEDELAQLSVFLQALCSRYLLQKVGRVTISGSMRTHVGLGSGTAIKLATVEGLHRLNGLQLSRAELIIRSQRGGTSGVGVTAYFSGKLVLDLGVPNDGLPSAPSSQALEGRLPLALPVVAMPEWPICLCIPKSIPAKSQSEEVEFFSRMTSLAGASSYRAAYEALFGIYGSVVDKNYRSFCSAIENLQTVEWKANEWNEYGDALQWLRKQLIRSGADCVGMSSLGPLLFCFGERAVLTNIVRAQKALDCEAFPAMPSNSGRVLGFVPQ